MRVLLLYPAMPDTFWNMKMLYRILGKKTGYPPLSLMTVAAMLPDSWEVRLCDLNAGKLRQADLDWADMFFISAMNVQAETVGQLIKRCRETQKTIVAGGPLFAHRHEDYPEVDHFILNEAEITLPGFLNDLEQNSLKRTYSTTGYCQVTDSPIPRYDLINPKKYAYGIIQYSRGCPFTCDFCDVTQLYGRKMRAKSATQIINELNQMGNINDFQLILFADDNLIGNKKKLKEELLPALIKWRQETTPQVSFGTQVSVNLAEDDTLIDLMLEAGFRHLFLGIETPEAKSLEASAKNQNLHRNLLDDIQKLHRKGFIITGGFIVGFDNDQPDIFDRQAEFIQKSGIMISTVNLLKAPEGTLLNQRLNSENRLLGQTDFDELSINFIPKMPLEELYSGYEQLINKVFSLHGGSERMKNFFADYEGAKVRNGLNQKVKFQDLLVFVRLFVILGIIHPRRFMFRKVLWFGIKNHLRHIELVLLFMVLMAHFDHQRTRFIAYRYSEEYKQLTREVHQKLNA